MSISILIYNFFYMLLKFLENKYTIFLLRMMGFNNPQVNNFILIQEKTQIIVRFFL